MMNKNNLNRIATPTPERIEMMRFSEIRFAGSSADILSKNVVEFSSVRICSEEMPLLPVSIKSKQKMAGIYNKMGLYHGTIPPVVPCPPVMLYVIGLKKNIPKTK